MPTRRMIRLAYMTQIGAVRSEVYKMYKNQIPRGNTGRRGLDVFTKNQNQ